MVSINRRGSAARDRSLGDSEHDASRRMPAPSLGENFGGGATEGKQNRADLNPRGINSEKRSAGVRRISRGRKLESILKSNVCESSPKPTRQVFKYIIIARKWMSIELTLLAYRAFYDNAYLVVVVAVCPVGTAALGRRGREGTFRHRQATT